MKHKKIQKTLGRLCPECGGRLHVVLRSEVIDGIEYCKSFIECSTCAYEETYRDLVNKSKLDY